MDNKKNDGNSGQYIQRDRLDKNIADDAISKNIGKKHKRALVIASVASMLDNFNRSNIDILLDLGYDVTIAANFRTKEDINSQEKIDEFAGEMRAKGVHIVHIAFSRKPSKVGQQIKSILQVRKLLQRKFDLIHCHSPICAAITRSCAKKYRKTGTKVIYTAHGFHFYDGAPIKNWLIFYPIEKHYSRYTDVLITINKEDYKRANEKFYAKKTVYVPGIGVDTKKFGAHYRGKEIRKELGLTDSDIMLLSVGELNENKNHEIIIKALAQMKKAGSLTGNLHYVIAGIGDKEEYLKKLIVGAGLDDRVWLVGYRADVADFYDATDVFIFPSFREGLSVSLMEAMASGLPVVCSRIRGNTDLIDEDKGGFFFDPANIGSVEEALHKVIGCDRGTMGAYNLDKIKGFDMNSVNNAMSMDVYGGVLHAI